MAATVQSVISSESHPAAGRIAGRFLLSAMLLLAGVAISLVGGAVARADEPKAAAFQATIAAAAWAANRKAFTLVVVNPAGQAADIAVKLSGAQLGEAGAVWQLAAADPCAHNDPAHKDVLKIVEQPAKWTGKLAVPAYSVSVFRFEAK